uniref:(California timema) hypothetical protein n=1 Tax=Timema californicum TaxID=61474 RepID=A0A7R9PC27_TIMCA|nr:unnamed protein product [Timema californicum]
MQTGLYILQASASPCLVKGTYQLHSIKTNSTTQLALLLFNLLSVNTAQWYCVDSILDDVSVEPAVSQLGPRLSESGKPFRKPPPPLPVQPTEIQTSISPSSAVEQLNTTSALANYATEAGVT